MSKIRKEKEEDEVRVLLVGGCGFVGGHLALAFVAKGWRVCVSDVTPLPPFLKEYTMQSDLWRFPLEYSRIDLAQEAETEKVIAQFAPTLVISIAGWGMSTFDMLSPRCWSINYEGTKTLVQICKRLNIKRFIYTSTYNVAFHGQKIENGDESMPYSPEELHVDEYSKSKTRAEQYVLQQASGEFLVVALRPGAIYGEDEMRHIPRIVHLMDLFMYSPAQIGSATVDWVHIDNLIQAYEKLSDKLLFGSPEDKQLINGQAYCINDNDPITNTAFLGPLCRARCRPEPLFTIPISVMLWLSGLFEFLYRHSLPTIQLFTRAEIYKAGQTHFFPPKKAALHFQYQPTLSSHTGAQQLADKYQIPVAQIRAHPAAFRVPHFLWWLSIALGMCLLAIVALEPTNNNPQLTWCVPISAAEGGCVVCAWCQAVLMHVYHLWVSLGAADKLGFYSDGTLLETAAKTGVSSTTGMYAKAVFVSLVSHTKSVAYRVFGSQWVLQCVWYAACVAHLGEALYAWCVARYWCHLSSVTSGLWFWQTLCLGYPSLSLLQAFHNTTVERLKQEALTAYVAEAMAKKKKRLFGPRHTSH